MKLQEELKSIIRTIPNFPKEGIMFKDITPIFRHPQLWDRMVDQVCADFKNEEINAVAGMESRGFLLGPLIAKKLNVPFVLIRKKGKLPAETISYSYDLEYGSATLEIHKDALTNNDKVLVHDDLLATGGTAIAASELITELKAQVVGYSFIVELKDLNGVKNLTKFSKKISNLASF